MQILQWLFKGEDEQEQESSTFSPPTKRKNISVKYAKGKDVIILKHHRAHRRTKKTEGTKLDCKNLKLFAFICGKDTSKTCFYRTHNLNRRRHFVHSMKMKGDELSRGVTTNKKADSNFQVGKKVLPVTEASFSTSTERNGQCCTTESKYYQTKGDKKKSISRIKELYRWAAAGKTQKRGKSNGKKVLQFNRCGTIKAASEDDQLSSESPKISFTWDGDSTTSVYSAISIASLSNNGRAKIAQSPIYILPEESDHMICRKENWITTEDFVVLEL